MSVIRVVYIATTNGKVEVSIKKILTGNQVDDSLYDDRGALMNPDSLKP